MNDQRRNPGNVSPPAVALMLGGLLTLALLPGCSGTKDPWPAVPGNGPRVLVSFPPLYCFAKNVAGDDAKVLSLLTTVGPHDHQATAEDAMIARGADLFLVNGLDLDEFTTRVVNNSGNRNKDLVRKVGESIPTSTLIPIGHEHAEGAKCDCAHGEHDPHVWLGIDEAVQMVNAICKALQDRAPGQHDAYRQRADDYIARLRKLHEDGLKMLEGKKTRTIITNHHSFGYFARSFKLTVEDAIQVQPGIEAHAQQLTKLIALAKAKQIRVIGVEPQYPTGAAEKLQQALRKQGVETTIIELDPIETSASPQVSATYYEERMRANLEQLAKHLQ
ncbi:MAG: metal ABC transporter substrate-binding protein [Gemmataceae bacterium]|nr:metal ABC transporter substrate-binding protein [Gemmataceae bacterium]